MTLLFKDIIDDIYSRDVNGFGRKEYYQSYEALNIKGQRPTERRFVEYNLKKYLNKNQSVIDIGCNVGFFSLYISDYVKEIFGIDNNPILIDIANKTRDYVKKFNTTFSINDFHIFKTDKKYDVVLSFAVHLWVNMSFEEYAFKFMSLTKDIIVIESHDPDKEDIDWSDKKRYFTNNGFTEVDNGSIKDDDKIFRLFSIFKKAESLN